MPSRLSSGVGALVILLITGHACAGAGEQDLTTAGEPKHAVATGKSRAPRSMALGATVESLLAAARELNPALRAAALETS
ncbi:MAG TPA: hypothetical protein VED87_00250, partial [Methylocystis sp.]|nr:hypothetical protein [Methylocystis sp.]